MKRYFHKNISWVNYRGSLIPEGSIYSEINIKKSEQQALLKKSGAKFIRWHTKCDKIEMSDFWFIIKDSFSGFEELSRSTRSKIRRGNKKCIVSRVSFELIIEKGYTIYKSAFNRYKNSQAPANEQEFKNNILKTSNNSEYFGVFLKETEQLIAYAKNIVIEDFCNYSVLKFHPDFLKNYPSYVLFYAMNKYYLEDRKLKYVTDGARSISHETNIQDFLITKFKFRKAYCKLHIYYRKDILLIIHLLFPFRKVFIKLSGRYIGIINSLLLQENIVRSCRS